MADEPTPPTPAADPPKADLPEDPPTPPAADPPKAEPPADPPKSSEDDDVIKDRAELERLREENATLKQAQKPKAPAPPKKAEKPKVEAEPPTKRRRRVSRLMGDFYDDED